MEAGASARFLPGPDIGGTRRLGDRYELGEVLGTGGTAEVYAAHDLRLDRGVAVKTLRSDLVGDPSSLARFRREALSAASLNHPSIVAVYDTGEDLAGGAPVPYIVMERVDGSTFADLLRGGPRLSPTRALELTAGVLEALAHAHRSGVVHSDIKPANVMLSDDGAVKVTDFGTARHVDVQGAPLTQHTTVVGTPKYLSPEQAQGEAVGAPADLYSTGCLLYELLTAQPPFLGDGVLELIIQHVESPPQPPSSRAPGLPPECDALVLRALNKAPGDRYRDAEEMLRDVERVLTGVSPTATTATVASAPTAAPLGRPDEGRSPAPPSTLHTDPTLVFPASQPPAGAPERHSGPPRRRRFRAAALLAGALLAVSAGGYAVTAATSGGPAAEAAAPPAGAATSQAPVRPGAPSPGRGTTAAPSPDRGTTEEPAPGRGTARTEVPDLVGSTPAQARTAARRAGLRVVPAGRATKGRRCGPTAGGPARIVCKQTPQPGTGVARGSEIRVKVGSGRSRPHPRPEHQ